jgi:hypothetical protein
MILWGLAFETLQLLSKILITYSFVAHQRMLVILVFYVSETIGRTSSRVEESRRFTTTGIR